MPNTAVNPTDAFEHYGLSKDLATVTSGLLNQSGLSEKNSADVLGAVYYVCLNSNIAYTPRQIAEFTEGVTANDVLEVATSINGGELTKTHPIVVLEEYCHKLGIRPPAQRNLIQFLPDATRALNSENKSPNAEIIAQAVLQLTAKINNGLKINAHMIESVADSSHRTARKYQKIIAQHEQIGLSPLLLDYRDEEANLSDVDGAVPGPGPRPRREFLVEVYGLSPEWVDKLPPLVNAIADTIRVDHVETPLLAALEIICDEMGKEIDINVGHYGRTTSRSVHYAISNFNKEGGLLSSFLIEHE